MCEKMFRFLFYITIKPVTKKKIYKDYAIDMDGFNQLWID